MNSTKKTKLTLLFLTFILFVFSFINGWYADQLFDEFFILALIPSIFLFIMHVFLFVVIIVNVFSKKRHILDFLMLAIILLSVLLSLFFPFREAKVRLEVVLYERPRLEIITMIKNKQLIETSSDSGNVDLPRKYRNMSSSGQVSIIKQEEDEIVIGFWVFRGMLSGSSIVMYSSKDEQLIKDNESSIISIEKLKEHWYYVKTDY